MGSEERPRRQKKRREKTIPIANIEIKKSVRTFLGMGKSQRVEESKSQKVEGDWTASVLSAKPVPRAAGVFLRSKASSSK